MSLGAHFLLAETIATDKADLPTVGIAFRSKIWLPRHLTGFNRVIVCVDGKVRWWPPAPSLTERRSKWKPLTSELALPRFDDQRSQKRGLDVSSTNHNQYPFSCTQRHNHTYPIDLTKVIVLVDQWQQRQGEMMEQKFDSYHKGERYIEHEWCVDQNHWTTRTTQSIGDQGTRSGILAKGSLLGNISAVEPSITDQLDMPFFAIRKKGDGRIKGNSKTSIHWKSWSSTRRADIHTSNNRTSKQNTQQMQGACPEKDYPIA